MKLRALFLVHACLAMSSASAEPLPRLVLQQDQTTVSGLSSGAFMTVQLQTAFSNRISGAGVVAGGPFGCADVGFWSGWLAVRATTAVEVCMANVPLPPDTTSILNLIAEQSDGIDPVSGLTDDRIYMFHGQADRTVHEPTMNVLFEIYGELGVPAENIHYVKTVDAGHGFLTEADATQACPANSEAAEEDPDCGIVACTTTAPAFLNACDVDQAGEILTWLYGTLEAPVAAVQDHLISFDQALYTDGAAGMWDSGFAYIPASCQSGETCRLHIALHGCQQGEQVIGAKYARLTQYNRWAEANDIVVLYPQAAIIELSIWNGFGLYGGNPNGCWDWWGYGSGDYLTRNAPQMAAIARMAEALGVSIAD